MIQSTAVNSSRRTQWGSQDHDARKSRSFQLTSGLMKRSMRPPAESCLPLPCPARQVVVGTGCADLTGLTRFIRSSLGLGAGPGRWIHGVMVMALILTGCTSQPSGPGRGGAVELLSGDAKPGEAKEGDGSVNHEQDYTSATLLSRLIAQDKEEAAYLGQVVANLGSLCGALYTLRTECPLLTHIITRRAQVVSCKTQDASQPSLLERSVLNVQLSLAQGESAFSHNTQLVLVTAGGGTFKLRFGAHQVALTQAVFISDSTNKHAAQFVDINQIYLQRVDEQPFMDPDKDVWLSLEVNGQQLLFDPARSGSFGVDNAMIPRRNRDGDIHRYEMAGASLAVLASWKKRKACQPNTKSLITNALPSQSHGDDSAGG